MSNKYLPEEELNLHVEDYGTAFKIDRKNSSEANDEDSEKSAASQSKKATDSEKRPRKQFYGEVLRQAIHEVGPAIILNHLKESKFKDVIKQIKQDLKSIAPDSVDDNDEELYYWNTRFQMLWEERDQNREQVNEDLVNLAKDFRYTAQMFGQIIIAERNLPPWKKTIKPLNLGGIAGGLKFIVRGILFKFAVDDTAGVHGGDEYAIKAAGHEMKGAFCVMSCKSVSIRVPLICIVDYLGYRVVAQSLVPIDRSTIEYGSNDGADTIHCGSPETREIVSKLAHELHLKMHTVLEATTGTYKEIYSPVDLEIHRGKDGKLYALDLARLMPPEYPTNKRQRGVFLRNLLRPEFLRSYKIPLSSDAFSGFVPQNQASRTDEKEIEEATLFLHQKVIPRCAYELSQSFNGDFPQLVGSIHSYGINLRHMGLIRSNVTRDEIKMLLLIEIIARTLRKLLWAELRDEMNSQKLHMPTEQAMRYRVVKFYNHFLTNIDFWRDPRHLKSKILERFPNALTEKENSALVSLTDLFTPASRLLLRFQALTNVTINSKTLNEMVQFFKSDVDTIVSSDVVITPIVKEMKFVSIESSSIRFRQAKEKKSLEERLQQYRNALNYIANRSVPESEVRGRYNLRNASYKIIQCLLKYPPGDIKWLEVEQHQARLQNIKPNEDYGTSPQDQFDNLVLRGDILRLLVHIDRIKPMSSNVTLKSPFDFLQRLSKAASWYLQANPFVEELIKLEQKRSGDFTKNVASKSGDYSGFHTQRDDESQRKKTEKKTPTPLEKLESKKIKLIEAMLSVISTFHTATIVDLSQVDGILLECAKQLQLLLVSLNQKVLAKMKVPDLNFSVGIVYCLHQLATHSDKVDKELLPYIFSKLPKLISFVADITPWPLATQKILVSLKRLPPDKHYNIISFDSYTQLDDQVASLFRDFKILTFSAKNCSKITNNALKIIATPSLIGINLDGTSIDDGGLAILASQSPYLQQVSVLGCRVTSTAVSLLIRSCLSIVTILAPWSDNSFDLRDCPHLTDKFLSNVQFSTRASLQKVSFGGCVRLSENAILSFFSRISASVSNLKSLDLSGCVQLSRTSLENLLRFCPNLQELNLSQCQQLDDALLRAIVSHLHRTLRVLDLSYCWEITDEGLKILLQAVAPLTSLSLKHCDKISFNILAQLAPKLPSLTSLDVSYCWRIGRTQLQQIKRPTLLIKYGQNQTL